MTNPRDPSESGADSGGADEQNPKEPNQKKLDADRKANRDKSKQVPFDDREGQAG